MNRVWITAAPTVIALAASGVGLASEKKPCEHPRAIAQPPDFTIGTRTMSKEAGSTAPVQAGAARIVSDELAARYSSEVLAPYEASRRTLHQLMLFVRERCEAWRNPVVNLAEDGALELEWWNGSKSLTITIESSRMRYLRAWGADPRTDMEDGDLPLQGFVERWNWLRA